MEYTGFIYIWFDRKHKRYYIGSRFGKIEDKYICSSKLMKKAYKIRPNDFTRKIIKYHHGDHKELFKLEQYYLDMIKDEELFSADNVKTNKCKYYNIKKCASGIFGELASNIRKKYWESDKGLLHKQKLSEIFKTNNPGIPENNRGKKRPGHSLKLKAYYNNNPEAKLHCAMKIKAAWENGRFKDSFKNRKPMSDETKLKMSEARKGKKQTDFQKKRAKEYNQKDYRITTLNNIVFTIKCMKDYSSRSSIPECTLWYLLRNGKSSSKWDILKIERI